MIHEENVSFTFIRWYYMGGLQLAFSETIQIGNTKYII